LFGLDFIADTSVEEVADLLERDGQVQTADWRVVVTPNVDHLVHYRKAASQRQLAQSAYLVLPDGAPIVLASRLLGARIDRRIAGSDLFATWWRRMVTAQRPVVIVASNESLAEQLMSEHPGCRCIVPPMFDAGDHVSGTAVVNEVLAELRSQPADAVVIGLSMTKHHFVASGLTASTAPLTGAPLLLLLGASAELYTGQQRRAPRWMQRTGTEWLYRLVQDPRRMAKRYLVDDLAFLPMVWREWRTRRTDHT
jgi:exopolysaccharide biosynthesis WecB/TagA/CpsF family protein